VSLDQGKLVPTQKFEAVPPRELVNRGLYEPLFLLSNNRDANLIFTMERLCPIVICQPAVSSQVNDFT